jgi:hypothetical protein
MQKAKVSILSPVIIAMLGLILEIIFAYLIIASPKDVGQDSGFLFGLLNFTVAEIFNLLLLILIFYYNYS